MKKIMPIVLVGILVLSGFGAGGLSNYESLENEISCFTVDKESISVTIHVGPYEIKNIEDRQEIFVNDSERPESFEDAVEINRFLKSTYQELGFNVVELPKVSIEERVVFIEDSLG